MDEEAKRAFNMKVLKRHDASITKILASASFVVLYSHREEWTKTGIEGPMFIYERSQHPYHGFFILNRNGVENFNASMSKEDDLEVTPEFIIYRPESSDSAQDGEVYGIWIFEPSQKDAISKEMTRLHDLATTFPSASSTSVPQSLTPGQSIPLDALFGASSSQASSSAAPAGAAQASTSQAAPTASSLPLMDQIFASARMSNPAPPQPQSQAQAQAPIPSEPQQTKESAPESAAALEAPAAPESPGNGIGSSVMDAASNLMSMLGIKAAVTPTAAPETQTPTAKAEPTLAPAETSSSTSHDVKAVADIAAAPAEAATAAATASPRPAKKKAGKDRKPEAPIVKEANVTAEDGQTNSVMRRAVASALSAQEKATSAADEEKLSRTDFVRQLLTLVHTDKAFVDALYADYCARCGPGGGS